MTAPPPVKDRIQSAKRSAPFDTDARARQRSRFTIHPDVEEAEEDEEKEEEEEDELDTVNQDPVAATPIMLATTRQRIVPKTPFVKYWTNYRVQKKNLY